MLKTHIGEFVYIMAGKYKGKCFIVLSSDDTFVCVCDGKKRKVEKPKIKNIKHISFTGEFDNLVVEKLSKNVKPTNKEVKQEISKFLGIKNM